MHHFRSTNHKSIEIIASAMILMVAGLYASLSVAAQDRTPDPLFTPLSPDHTGITFANHIVESEDFNINVFIYSYNGGGVAVGDVNNDGLPDVYFSGTQSHTPNRLYLNRGNLTFEDVSAEAGVDDSLGVRYGVSMVDVNADGWLDIYVNHQDDSNRLYINNQDGTFTDRASEYGIDHCCSSTQTTFLDYDRDGDLDAYIGINGDARGDDYTNKGWSDRFYVNNGDGTFTDLARRVGIRDRGYALSVTAGDVNNDGWPDIYVANDFRWPDNLYINNQDGTFTESAKRLLKHTTEFGMGSDIADFNNDGLLDIIALDMLPEDHTRKMSHMGGQNTFSPLFDSTQMMRNTLQLNRGNGMFSEIAQLAGIDETDWSWAPLFGDFDLDGHQDLFISNGFKRDIANLDVIKYLDSKQPMEILDHIPEIELKNYAYRNNGDLTFTKVSDEWGVGDYVNSNGAMYADLDSDGDLDLLVNNIDTVASIYQNNAVERGRGNYVKFSLEGVGQNRDGIGARVQIRYGDDKTQVREFFPVRGYLSSSHDNLHFGLGNVNTIDRVLVTWPDGSAQVLENVNANQVITLRQDEASGRADLSSLREPQQRVNVPRKFTPLDNVGLDYKHVENSFDDFNRERLMPHKLSRNGPGIAVGDIDMNGLDDIWVGGARGRPGAIFMHNEAGTFTRIAFDSSSVFEMDRECEDMGGLFFDADQDGDLDLYVASGGNEVDGEGDSTLADRLYINDGNGNFTRDNDALPGHRVSTSSVSAADYDRDGDFDLFVGGRCVPGMYPDISRSFLYENRSGRFVDITASVSARLTNPGMVTSAIWSDFDGDGWQDLVVTGEWMPIEFYRNEEGESFSRVTAAAGMDSSHGWWHSLSAGDFDNDGDIDYVAGNMGQNTKQTLQPTRRHPIRLYSNDFDGNTSRDLIMTYYYDGKEYPARNKMDLASQMGSYTKRRFPTYSEYARSTIDSILKPQLLEEADKRFATTFFNAYIENNGDGTFRMHRLPTLAQTSPVFGTTVGDFNADGNLDVLGLENFHAPDKNVVRYDAGYGLFLAGDGRGGFTVVPVAESGFHAPHDGRGIAQVDAGLDSVLYVLAVNNDERAQLFRHTFGPYRGRLIRLDPSRHYTHAIITFDDGSIRRHEFHFGSGYLSQSSPSLIVTEGMTEIELYDGMDKTSTLYTTQ